MHFNCLYMDWNGLESAVKGDLDQSCGIWSYIDPLWLLFYLVVRVGSDLDP